jgi:hypothetical protein
LERQFRLAAEGRIPNFLGMATLYVFPDTNLLLHFQRLDQIDWTTITGASEVVIVLAPVVIGELDDIKNRHESRKLKQRARDINEWVRKRWQDPNKVLRDGVSLEFATSENDEHLTNGLVSRLNDDRLIANALAFHAAGKDAAVASNDTIVMIKAETRGLQVILPTDDLALPLEKDDVERERDGLKRELDAQRARVPKLEFAWHNAADRGEVAVRALKPPASSAQIASRLPVMRKANEQPPHSIAALSFAAMGVSASAIDAYNAELARFHKNYEKFYDEMLEAIDHNRRLVELQFLVRNVGTTSATYVTIHIDLPLSMTAAEDNCKKRKLPREPTPPEEPAAFGLFATRDFGVIADRVSRAALVPPYPRSLSLPDPLAPEIENNGRRISWSLPRLLHSNRCLLKTVRCLIAPELIGRDTQLRVTLHSHELLAPMTGVFELSFQEMEAD